MARKNLPGYLKHKATGQAFCVISGRFFYLGKYGSKASREEYERIIGEYLNNGKKLPPLRNRTEITIEELAVKFLEYAEGYYVQNGRVTETFGHCKLAIGPVVRHYGTHFVSSFGPLALTFIRDKWVAEGTARKTINRWVGVVKQMFQWGTAHELVEADIYHALQAVANLKAGRTVAPEYDEVLPVDDEIVEKTLPHLPPIIADMVQVQRFAGFRPQDVRNLRGCDIDRSGDIWKYTPYTHKTKHRGKSRELAIGPRAQRILEPYLVEKAETPEAFLFSPADSVRLQRAEQRQNRKSKVQPSQVSRKKAAPKTLPREQYSKDSYNRAIRRACEKLGIEPWCPNQLRHSTGTDVRDKYGLDYAQAVMGHASAKTTEIYAKVAFEKAAEVMREIG